MILILPISISLQHIPYVQYQKYLTWQFSLAYNIYWEICKNVDTCASQVLGQNKGEYQLKHTCPACMYKLHDELPLVFDILHEWQ